MKVAFIGMGTMGVGMAMNILKAGHELTVHNRTREKEEPLAAAGAQRAASPQEAAADAEIIVICVSDTPDVEEIILGNKGVIHGAPQGAVVVDNSTISPGATRHMADKLAENGVDMLDAPVSGGSEGAQNGTLSIMVGGEVQVFERALPVLEAMGKTITHVGPIGAGQITKAINQIVITGTYLTMAEGLAVTFTRRVLASRISASSTRVLSKALINAVVTLCVPLPHPIAADTDPCLPILLSSCSTSSQATPSWLTYLNRSVNTTTVKSKTLSTVWKRSRIDIRS